MRTGMACFVSLWATMCIVAPSTATAQSVGTFRWQLQPFCNVLTISVTQTGGVYTLDGFDDLCGATVRGSATGVAFPNTNGTIGFGVTVVLSPSGMPLHIGATIDLTTFSGTWSDSAGNAGAFVFNPSIAPGAPRPPAKPVFSLGLSAGNTTITQVGPPAVATDAATKGYVDSAIATSAGVHWLNVRSDATLRSASSGLSGATVERPATSPAGVYCIRFPPGAVATREAAVGSLQQSSGGAGVVGFITVTVTFGNLCNAIGSWDVAVQTYNSAGTPTDRPFTLLIPRS